MSVHVSIAGARRPARFATLGTAGALLAKVKVIWPVLKLLKFSKPLVTIFTMAFSAVVYGLTLGPWFGAGLVAMLFLHEMGHVAALRLKGIETPGPVFIPFLGAAIFVGDFKDRNTEAFVGYGGPLIGTIAALICFVVWFATGQANKILLLLSYSALLLNLLNLIPLSPLDGGRIAQAIGGWFRYVGIGVLGVYIVAYRQPSLFLIMMLALGHSGRWGRPAVAALLFVAMAVLDHFSGQDLFGDLLLGLIIVAVYAFHDLDRQPQDLDTRENLPVSARAKWLVCYAGLVAVALLALAIQIPLLPHP